MQAWFIDSYGTPPGKLSLREVPDPSPGPGEVSIEVEAVALNPVDLKTVRGESKMLLPMKPPFVPGVDLAGRVLSAGAGVTLLQPGDTVVSYTGMARMGAFSERVVLPASMVGKAPVGWSAEEASTLPLPALCASQALEAGGLEKGKRILVHGGAGGVGSLAVQLAAARGAVVLATASPRDQERVQALGASVVIDYTTTRFEDRATECDVVFDTVGGETLYRSFSAVRPGGVVVSLHGLPSMAAMRAAGLAPPSFLALLIPVMSFKTERRARKSGTRFAPQLTIPDGARLSELKGLPLARPLMGRKFAFQELPAAFELLSTGNVRGRITLVR